MSTSFSKVVIQPKSVIEYQDNSIVSKTVCANNNSSLTLFAFDEGQSIAAHSAPVDAVVQVVEGQVEITISDETFHLKEGDTILMPKGEPHGLKALGRFKMMLFKV